MNLTIKKAANFLGISYHAMLRRVQRDFKKDKKKYSSAKKFGRDWMISKKDLIKKD